MGTSKRKKRGDKETNRAQEGYNGTKKLRFLHLSPNVNDYDTGEPDVKKANGSISLSNRSKKTGNKFRENTLSINLGK
ncbi:MAG TPA: hypothetical protein VEH06_13230 [Candidatus Bathyarchaeia archaeon]|nr:hypothetical protein [Candidatus Bathyarchaeia archaeon]